MERTGGEFDPPLTTVRQPTEEQLRRAWACPPSAWDAGGFPAFREILGRLSLSAGSPGFAESPKRELFALAALSQTEMSTVQEKLGHLSEFDRAMNQVTEPRQLNETLREWLPFLGIHRFALPATCDSGGEMKPYACGPGPEVLFRPFPIFSGSS